MKRTSSNVAPAVGMALGLAMALLIAGWANIARAENGSEAEGEQPAATEQAAEEPAEDAPAEEPQAEEEKAETQPAAEKPASEEKPKPTPPQEKPAAKPADDQKTHTVKAKPFKIEKKYKATFVPSETAEIVLRPETWSSLKVEEAVDHGSFVHEGQVILKLETEDLDRAIADQKLALQSQELSLEEAVKTLEVMERSVPFDLESAERSYRHAKEDYKEYVDVDREFAIRSAEMSLKSSRENLEYEEEELRQLEKMYKADDLTEETEEIILKRQRAAVEQARFYYERAKRRHELFMEYDLPRNDEDWERGQTAQELRLARSRISLPALLEQQRVSVKQAKISLERAEQKLGELVADREKMVVKAPCDGVLYYGEFERGKWKGAGSGASKLRPGGSVSSNDVLMTIVPQRTDRVVFTVSEEDRRWITSGLEGTATPTVDPHMIVPVEVTHVASVPFASGQFEAEANVDLPVKADGIFPAMTCEVRFVPHHDEAALVVPAKAVFTEDLDPAQHYVYRVVDGKPQRCDVRVGEKSGEDIEILRGLREGDVILAEKPNDE